MMHESLPQKLRVLRAQKGWTLIEAARRAGVGRDTLSDLERGRQHPVMPTLAKIADGYEVPVEELLVEDEPTLAGKGGASETGPPQVSREELAAENISVTGHEVEEVNNLIMAYWRLGQGEKAVSYFSHEDVDQDRIWMLAHLVLGTPSIVTPEQAGVIRRGMRERLTRQG